MKNIVLFLSAACLLSTPIFGQQQENRFAEITDPQLLRCEGMSENLKIIKVC